ncbi:MAG: PHP domain-containing protein [Candidatus Eremiobacteraeota bacterium]|nr:PHP domain-containing protein [Candidatus Eremiobacteraeota bacterium]MBV8366569.1 PHP domain-containing protein [Candidatus Eremiobacteraeota bacterium]
MLCDLHLHSNRSDGELAPEAVVDAVADAGVELVALTDHDTTAGHAAARTRAADRGVRFIGGIEMTTYDAGRVVHVLGFNVSDRDGDLRFANEQTSQIFGENQERWIRSLASEGVAVEWNRDFADAPVRLPVLIERLCRRGFEGGDPQRCHGAFRAFFASLPAHAYEGLPTPAQAGAIIRGAGGVAMLAHPADLVDDGLADQLLDELDGLEAMYMRYDSDRRSELCGLARRRGKLYSCGSDWHGWFQGAYVNPQFEAPPDLLQRLEIQTFRQPKSSVD